MDIDVVRRLDRQLFPETYFEGPEDGNVYWLLFDFDTPVGFCSVRPSRFDPEHTVFLSRAGILPVARGLRLHRRMIRARCRWARKHGFEYAITYCYNENKASAVNLIKEGFLPWKPPESIGRWAGEDAMYFRKTL